MSEDKRRRTDQMDDLRQEYEQLHMSSAQVEKMKEKIHEAKTENQNARIIQMGKRGNRWIKVLSTAAAVALVFIVLPNTSAGVAHAMEQIPILGNLVKVVTFRDYQYDSQRNMADVEVPQLTSEGVAENAPTQEALDSTTGEINAEIQAITEQIIQEFEANIDEENYQDVIVKSEVLTATEDYFTLKLICYQGAGSGYEWNYFYTIDLKTGQRLQLKDLFVEGADYITPISRNIKKQMRQQMKADENVTYWVDDEIEELNFKAITDETSFYLNENGEIVIAFNEGDVAPMYMGTVEFVIPHSVVKDILK